MKALSLFSGIGGIDLACEWAGIETVAFCEREQFPQRVLRKHWPDVPIIDDVHDVTRKEIDRIGIGAIDLVSAGFPCQPFSAAGKREGTDDERYLWPEVIRVLEEIKPPWFVGENVAGLLSMAEPDGEPYVESRISSRAKDEDFYEAIFTQQEIMLIGRLCQELEDIGYEVAILCLPAAAVGSTHLRDRVVLLGYSKRGRQPRESWGGANEEPSNRHCGVEGGVVADSAIEGLSIRGRSGGNKSHSEERSGMDARFERCCFMANTTGERCGETREHSGRSEERIACIRQKASGPYDVGDRAAQSGMGRDSNVLSAWMDGGINPLDALMEFVSSYPQPSLLGQEQYDWEPPRVAVGVKDRAPRLKALGNAVSPLQFYPILAAIKQIDDILRDSAIESTE